MSYLKIVKIFFCLFFYPSGIGSIGSIRCYVKHLPNTILVKIIRHYKHGRVDSVVEGNVSC